jgi:6-phosphogluconolactonase (cycloisomerase 2 family)
MPRHLGTLLAALVLVASGCDSSPPPGQPPDSGSDAGRDAGGPGDAGPTDAGPDAGGPGDAGTGDGGTGALIGPTGGTVKGWYGAEVTIPAGALPSPVFIEVNRDGTGAPPDDGSAVFSAGAPYALLPHGTSFAIPATVRIPFDPAVVPTDGVPRLYQAEPDGGFAPIPTAVDGGFLVADVASFSWFLPGYAASRPRMVYAFTSGANGSEVTSFKIDQANGGLGAATSSAPVGQIPVAVSVHPSRRFAYVVNGGFQAANGIDTNSISVYPLDQATGAISGPIQTRKASADSPPGEPVAAVVHPTGKFLYVVNHDRFGSADDTDLSVFTIDSTDGTLSAPTRTADSGGAAPTAVALSVGGHFAYVTYMHRTSTPVGNTFFETVKTFAVNPVTGELSGPVGSAPTGTAPWAIKVDPNDRFAFVASISSDEVQIYTLDSKTGVLSLKTGVTVQSKPSSLAVDSEGRFLYVGKQQPFSNRNLEVYSVDDGSGALSFAGGLPTGAGSMVGPMAVVAEPQGQFVYAVDQNGNLIPFQLDPSTGGLTQGAGVSGAIVGGSFGGVGDPSGFAASGTSPYWVDGCSLVAGAGFVFDACPLPASTGTTITGEGGGDPGTQHPPATSFVLTVHLDPAHGGHITSTPAGIDVTDNDLPNAFMHRFPAGASVSLHGYPSSGDIQSYDASWTIGCSGTGPYTSVTMSSDVDCYLNLTLH